MTQLHEPLPAPSTVMLRTLVRVALAAVTTVALCIGVAGLIAPPAASRSHLAGASVYIAVGDGHGSGVYLGNGAFVTAAHVVEDGPADGKITVKTSTGGTYDAEVLWRNKAYDVALIATKRDVPVRAADLACGQPELSVGDSVYTVGNPINLRDIRTWGRIARSTQHSSDAERKESGAARDWLIADMTIAPGNSGGPVFDSHDRLAGIAVAVVAMPGLAPVLFPISYVVPVSTICKLMGRS